MTIPRALLPPQPAWASNNPIGPSKVAGVFNSQSGTGDAVLLSESFDVLVPIVCEPPHFFKNLWIINGLVQSPLEMASRKEDKCNVLVVRRIRNRLFSR